MPRSFDLTEPVEKLIRAGMGRIQRMSDDVYRNLWPKSVELPEKHAGRFDRVLLVDAFPPHPIRGACDHDGRRSTFPVRLMPLPYRDKPELIAFGVGEDEVFDPSVHARHGELLRYVLFWQAGERWKHRSPNAVRSRFDADERGLRVVEGLHLPLQEEELVRSRRLPLADHQYDRGETYFLSWAERPLPTITLTFGMFAEMEGVPSCAKEVIPVSTEFQDFFLT